MSYHTICSKCQTKYFEMPLDNMCEWCPGELVQLITLFWRKLERYRRETKQ